VELVFLALLLIILALALGSGYPVAFALPGAAIVTISVAAACGYLFAGSPDAYFAQGGPSQWLSAGVTNLRGIYWEVERDTLIAIPLFIFMGIMLQRSKIAEDLLLTMAQLFGPVPGGLGISVVFVGALLAATTGIVGATVVAMGLISLPVMLRNNYSPSLATGTIAASGTLGQIIPPSIVLIILADQLASATDQASTARKALYKASTGEISMPSEFGVSSTSAGEMFLGAFVPGLVLVGLYMAFILVYALINPKNAPAVRNEEGYDSKFLIKVLATLVPPLTLIFFVLGSIISGIATVNQAGAIGAAGAIRVMRIENTLYEVMIDTAKTTSLVFIILLGAAMLTAAFRAFGGEELVRDYLNSLPGGFWTKFVIVMAVIFILGFFLDFIEIAVVVVPIVAPILLADPSANITAVWLGVMIGLNIQTSFLTPPFGFALFYLRGVAPSTVKTIQMYRGVIAFIMLQIIALGIVGYYPQLVNYLPKRLQLTADTAPPPRNPKLQYCVEDYVSQRFVTDGDNIRSAIATASALDFSMLPNKLAKEVEGSFASAEESMQLLADADAASLVVEEASADFRPLHAEVRDITTEVAQLDRESKELNVELRRLDDDRVERRASIEQALAQLDEEKQQLLGQTPAEWEQARADFSELQKTERDLRNKFRRAADKGYSPIAKLQQTLSASEAFDAMENEISTLKALVESEGLDTPLETIAAVSKQFGEIEGASKIKSEVAKARKALRAKKPDAEKALKALDKAQSLYDEQKEWRQAAVQSLSQPIAEYEQSIRSNIGIRQQSKLSKEQALYVAKCDAGHRDISLNF